MKLSSLTFAILGGGLLVAPSLATANVEVGGFAGVHIFSKDNELGVFDTANSPSEGNSFMAGLRVGVFFNDFIGVEGEFGVLPTNARVENNHYGITNLTYRAHVVVQFLAHDDDAKLVPFVLAGEGAFTIVNSNNKGINPNNHNQFIDSHDTDPATYFGVGVKYRVSHRWGLRADARLLLPPSSKSTGVTLDGEFLASIYADFGRGQHKEKVVEVVDDDPDHDGIHGAADKCPNDPEDKDGFQDADGCPDLDNDGDGIPDAQDKCPNEPEDKDGFQDADGCPDLDNDQDGIPDAQDKCPNEPEDKDGFQDADGCPDPDNDQDGIPDAQDKCPNEPETKNGYQDADGCPDEIPDRVKAFSGVIQGINFRLGSADLLPISAKTLDKAVVVLKEFKDIKIEIQGHTDDQPYTAKKGGKFADNLELSQGRAESVRQYLIKKGIDENRLVAKGYGDSAPIEDPNGLKGAKLTNARSKNRRVEFRLISFSSK